MEFRQYLESGEPIDVLVATLKDRYPGLTLFVSENALRIYIHEIRTNPPGQGVGTKVIEALQQYAQSVGKPIVLSPQSDRGKKAKLLNFYKNVGFYPNTGRRKDYSLSNFVGTTWLWRPRKP